MASRLPSVFDTSPRSSIVGTSGSSGVGRGSISAQRPPVIAEGDNEEDEDEDEKEEKDGSTLQRVHSTPVWPTELPDVFAFPESFFQLQRDLGYSVLEYLVKRGYANAADKFIEELDPECGIASVTRTTTTTTIDDNHADAFDKAFEEMEKEYNTGNSSHFNEHEASMNYEEQLKQEQAVLGLESAHDRREVMMLIIDRRVEECIDLINLKWPHFFQQENGQISSGNSMLKLRLRHQQVMDSLEKHVQDGHTGISGDFLKSTIAFIQEHLTDPHILTSDALVKDMEDTMSLLVYGLDSTTVLRTLSSREKRRALAEDVNSALQGTRGSGTPRLQQLAKLATYLDEGL